MTNEEKFEQIFGISVDEADYFFWRGVYEKHNYKKYKAILRGRGNEKQYDEKTGMRRPWSDTIYAELVVYASNKKEAREKAIKALGNKYRRWEGSNRPIYALDIVKEQEHNE